MPSPEALKRLLHTRVRRVRGRTGDHYRLDLRRTGLRGGRLVVRDPSDPRWPYRGRAARTEAEALGWLDDYAERLGTDWITGKRELVTLRAYGAAYLAKLKVETSKGSSTYLNYRSAFTNYIQPQLGSQPLRTIRAEQVQGFLDTFRTTKGGVPGSALKGTVHTVLSQIWRFAFGRTSRPPWAGEIEIDRVRPAVARRIRAESGLRVHELGRGYTTAELHWIMVSAVALDIIGDSNPRKRRGIGNHCETVASLIYQIVRAEEVTFVRHKDVDEELAAICIPGTKTGASEERFAPIQVGYRPWLERALSRGSQPDDFLLPTSHVTRLPSPDTLKEKVRRILHASGLKRPGSNTQIFRGTAISIALGAGLTADQVALLAGHRLPDDPLINHHYLRWASFLQSLGDLAFTFMPLLGTPEELEEEARSAIREGKLNL